MRNNTAIWIVAALIIGGFVGWLVGSSAVSSQVSSPQYGIGGAPPVQQPISSNGLELRMNMRKLWEDHISWTRMYLVSDASDADDTDAVAQRLLKNQEDIGNAIKPYYGDEAGTKLTALLKEHIMLATEIVKAAKANDNDALDTANTKWYANASEIADFLSSANPNWPKEGMRSMMREHLDLTKQEAVNILNKRFEENIADYDKIHNQILRMADMFSEGIIKQFPDKFR